MNEVQVQASIDDEENALLDAIPNIIDADKSIADLQSCGNPDTKDADVDGEQN